MSRRSPTNDRYKKDAQIGTTRRSAASVKPKRPQADIAGAAKPAEKTKGKAATKPKQPRVLLPNPDTPEFRRWNIANYALLGLALAFAFVVLVWGHQLEKTPFYYVMWAGWAVALGGSVWIQLSKRGRGSHRVARHWDAFVTTEADRPDEPIIPAELPDRIACSPLDGVGKKRVHHTNQEVVREAFESKRREQRSSCPIAANKGPPRLV